MTIADVSKDERPAMPRRNDLKKILILGAGPIVIGQGCEFDYAGTQAVKALREEGYQVVVVNSNPATIMTDPEMAERTYIEPLEVTTVTAILERERPDAILPTFGGQTALNLVMQLHEQGVLARLGVEMIGAKPESITRAENRAFFKAAVESVGLACPKSAVARSVEEARLIAKETGFPAVLRASFTLGGSGGGVALNASELDAKVEWALAQSPTREVLIEESVLGWKEFELEVIRDKNENFIVVCTIENIDPMGVHTGDSITVTPAMTLTDREFQRLRDAARAVMNVIGVETGGANVQFAVNPANGEFFVIEMNPRVSRSSALASKATGYPIAKVAAKLAVGYSLDELTNDITKTSAAFEPVIDYVVVKWPRFAFEKFPGTDPTLGLQMKSVGEAMAIGRTFASTLQKAARSLETGRDGLVSLLGSVDYRRLALPKKARDLAMEAHQLEVNKTLPPPSADELLAAVLTVAKVPTADRLFYVADAMRLGVENGKLFELTAIDPWFLSQIRRIVLAESELAEKKLDAVSIRKFKRLGFSDGQIARATKQSEDEIRELRKSLGVAPVFARVDTCAAEFVAHTPYLYSTYESASESDVQETAKKILILGGGPNRIGQGIEFDYCCVHAVQALRALGFETVMMNCNPETVSTDYDTANRLYFEPLTLEDVLAICDEEKPVGVIVQFGGQTPLKLAMALREQGITLLGTSADAIDRAEDRGRFDELLGTLKLRRPRSAGAKSVDDALRIADEIGFPVLVRPSYVLGGRAMMIAYEREELRGYIKLAFEATRDAGAQTILIDEFLNDAIEVDVDCLCDQKRAVIGGVMQHIEEAGVHSGDSSSILPPYSLSREIVASIEEQTRMLALELGVLGLMNVQFAVKGNDIYVLEVNPRASRTVPFISKATGRPLARIAAQILGGKSLDDLNVQEIEAPRHVSVKESIFPFAKFPGVDTVLGPEMRSTGEVMGISRTVARALGKAMLASAQMVTVTDTRKTAFISVNDHDKPAACVIARRLSAIGFEICATRGTADAIERARVPVQTVRKVLEGSPHVVDAIRGGTIALVVTTTKDGVDVKDGYSLRRQTLLANIPYFTTIAAALAACDAIEDAFRDGTPDVLSLQEWGARAPDSDLK